MTMPQVAAGAPTPPRRNKVSEIEELIGTVAMVALAETFGGTRLFVPDKLDTDRSIVKAIGIEAARLLSRRLGGATVRVPLARELRAAHYRRSGHSNAQVAVKLGITETGVDRLFARLKRDGKCG